MAITGLVLTLSEDEGEREQALVRLAGEPCVTLGEPKAFKYPAVLDTPSSREDRDCFDRLEATAGVNLVELVCVSFEGDTGSEQ
jgi:hypothetical protein